MKSTARLLIPSICVLTPLAACDLSTLCPPTGDPLCQWSHRLNGTVLEIAFGCGGAFPQYAALHTESGYLRLNFGPDSDWGTSIVVPPSFWKGGVYYQGTAVSAVPRVEGDDLHVDIAGSIGGLAFSGRLRFSPPGPDAFTCDVTMETTGAFMLDDRPGEAFKPLMLSSMHISDEVWDAAAARAGPDTYPIPDAGWIIQPPREAATLSLPGGASTWKDHAPTIEIELDSPLPVTGWVTPTTDPNDDNVGYWPASDSVPASWHYVATARP